MRLLFLLVFAPLCVAYCPSGHYKDDTFHKCVKCTPCHIVQIPCTKYKDAVCSPVNDSESHHFQKNRIHFFDDAEDEDEDLDEEMHSKNFVNSYYDSYYPQRGKDHHKKVDKHSKTKHEDKHHHKKKHYEFDSREEFDDYNDDKFDSEENIFAEKPKHKKHYEFTKKYKKKTDFLTPEEVEDEKLHFILGKENMKAKKKMMHHKKINADEETLEQWLKQSQKQLKLRKDDFLKTLKEESGENLKANKKVRLNSPVSETEVADFYSKSVETKPSKIKKHVGGASLKALADLEESDDGLELTSLIYNDDDNKVYTSSKKTPTQDESASSEIIGQGETADEVLQDEMGQHLLMERPRFNVIPLLIENEAPNKKVHFIHPSDSSKKNPAWNDELSSKNENRMGEDMKTHDVVSLPFSAAETLVWDWQAVAVASAVASCLVFFLVVAIYFIVNARQWKKVNKTYNKEIEEMSTRIALMQPTFESGTGDSHTTSLYMENILFPGKDEEKKGDQKV